MAGEKREAEEKRTTRETEVSVTVRLGRRDTSVATGIGF